jgi:hypothetical protein
MLVSQVAVGVAFGLVCDCSRPSAGAEREKPLQISTVGLIACWIAAAEKLDIYRVFADRFRG